MTARFMVAGALCATLALGTPVAAFADSNTTTSTSPSQSGSGDWMSAESAYLAHRHGIRVNYRVAVNAARSAFVAKRSKARSIHARNAARATLLSTIAAADAYEAAALASLGSPPAPSGELDGSEFNLERQAVNQDYADVVDAEMATYRAVVAAATSSAQLVTARANLRLGIAEATTARSSALVALGSRSSKVVKSVKPGKGLDSRLFSPGVTINSDN
ncbi:MAG TPA: hypothetical protein VMV96_00550 [Acidimicrobiales bacterium]|nr:hypothetical protein [Acidimicrobiales bacterium]